jgi:Piezo non-specific cation channel, R-Ras-binding domain
MPYTLHLYQLALDIMYARQDGDLVMEEILYNGLIDIYRDPHEMVRWSGQRVLKPPREWWCEEPLLEGYGGYPSFRETDSEPYIHRVVE